jgi:integrase
MPSPRHVAEEFAEFDMALAETERARFKGGGLAPLTILSYERDLRVFTAWCAAAHRCPLPATPETVELYAADMLRRGRKVTTLERHIVAIQRDHLIAGQVGPCGAELRSLLSGARRILCQRPNQKTALRVVDLRAMVTAIGCSTPIGARNSALLLFGFASALRRSSLARLNLEDLDFRPRGILVRIYREKQDRVGLGRELAVPRGKHSITCPVRALKRWIRWRGDDDGPVFQRVVNGRPNGKPILGNRICQIIQESAELVGLQGTFGAHSLRSGLATEALENGCNEIAIAQQTGHASLESLRIYFRSRDLFRGNVCARLGL